MSTPLGERLREARERMGWTQTEVSRMTGIPNLNISTYERGTRKPDIDVLAKLADLYQQSLDALVKGRSEDNNTVMLKLLDEEPIHVTGVFTAHDKRLHSQTQIVMIPWVDSSRIGWMNDEASVNGFIPMLATELDLQKYTYYWLEISDNAMVAEGLRTNMLVLARKHNHPVGYTDGSIRVVEIDEMMSLRRVFELDDMICLQAANPEYPLQTIGIKTTYDEFGTPKKRNNIGEYGLGEVIKVVRDIGLMGY